MRGSIAAPDEKPRQQISTLKRFSRYLRPYRKEVPIALSLVSIGAATQAIGPF